MKKIFMCVCCFATFYFAACAKQDRGQGSLVNQVVIELASDQYQGRKVGTPQNKQAALYIADQYRKVGLKPAVGVDYLVPFVWNGDTLYNVVGKLDGTIDSFYAIGAHFDHIGADNIGQDNVYNGADDNASGVGAMIGIAEYFAKSKPHKSMLFIAFNAEEVGLVGSEELADNVQLAPILARTQVLINLEMIGTIAAAGKNTLFITGDAQSNLFEIVNFHAQNGLKVVADPYPNQGLFFRSDNVSFYKKGIVAHSLSTCDMENTNHYHQKNDDVHVINFENLNRLTLSLSLSLKKMMADKSLSFKYHQ